jgi:hypothetical protein
MGLTPMSDDLAMGPIDFLIVEFPGSRMTGEGLRALVNLADRGIIRVLDLVFVRKNDDHSLTVLAIADLDGDGTLDLAIFEGVSSGLIGTDDVDEAGAVLKAGNSAAILIYENRWAAPMAAALRRGGAELVASGRIPFTDFATTLDSSDLRDGAAH